MADQVPQQNPYRVPSVEELRQAGRERMMIHFLWHKVTPPDDLGEMARVAHELLLKEAEQDAAIWAEIPYRNDLVPMADVLRGLGIDPDAGAADESAAYR